MEVDDISCADVVTAEICGPQAASLLVESLAVALRPLQRRLAETNFADLYLVFTSIEFCVSSICFITSVLLPGPVLNYYELMRSRLVVEHDSETKRWAAFFPELPGCTSAGDTEDEAIRNAKEALELWFAL